MDKHVQKTVKFLFLLALIIGFSACQPDRDDIGAVKGVKDYNADVAYRWNELMLEIDRYAPGYRPPAGARMLAYSGLAAYESVVAGMPEYKSVAGYFPGLSVPQIVTGQEYHWPTVVNEVYNYMFEHFYPHISDYYKSRIQTLHAALNTEFSEAVSEDVLSRSADYGKNVAAVFFAWSSTDEIGHKGYQNPNPADYVPPVGPGKWKPTKPDYTRALFPYWGQVRPFAVTTSDMLAKPPLTFSENPVSPFYGQAYEVYTLTTPLDPERQWIAEFWSDDIFELTFEPAARWVAIANQVIDQEQAHLETAVYTYAKLGMAMCDAGIITWNSKYYYNVERPVDYIDRLIDPSWNTSLKNPINGQTGLTPPFPAYPSGHAAFGASAAEVLSNIFDYKYAMTDRCHQYRVEFNGTPRSFNNFYEMAQENAISRLYLGVHYRMDSDEGLRVGFLAGRRVNDLRWRR